MSDCCNKCGSITLFKGTNGDYVQVTPEPAGGNCPEGGLKVEIISGVDDTTVKDTQYVCNGEQGPQGIQGIQGPAGNDGADGINGTDGQGIDHVSRTAGDGSPGTTDTYTVWGDVGETINLGTFTVYNGADGSSGGNNVVVINLAGEVGQGIELGQALPGAGLQDVDLRPNETYIIQSANGISIIDIHLPDSLGSYNGGFAPQIGDTIIIKGDPNNSLLYKVGPNTSIAGVEYKAQLPTSGALNFASLATSIGYVLPAWISGLAGMQTTSWDGINPAPTKFHWIGNTVGGGFNLVAGTEGLYIECTYTNTDEWTITDHSWISNSLVDSLFIDLF